MVLFKRKGKVYCICRKPDDGSFMVQCDSCKEWFHGKCVHITQEQADKLTRYHCATCKRRKTPEKNPPLSTSSTTGLNTGTIQQASNSIPPNTTLSTSSSPPSTLLSPQTSYPPANTTTQSPHTPHSIPFQLPSSPPYVNTTSPSFSSQPSPTQHTIYTPTASPTIFSATDTDMPTIKRHRLEGDPSTLSPHSSFSSSNIPDREKFWEIIRRSRGQA